MVKTPQKQKGFIQAIVSAIGGVAGGAATSGAAKDSAEARNMSTAEQRRQFNITQEQNEPWRAAGERGLGAYEEMLNQYGDYEVQSDIPEAYVTPKNLPALRDFQSGNYLDRIESNVPDEFSYSNEDFMGSAGRDVRLQGGLDAIQARRGNVAIDDTLSQNLANREYGAARGRAYDDYETDVSRETDRYGRGTDEYGRLTQREGELYGRDRQGYMDDVSREQETSRRGYRDYTTDVSREEENYRRGLETYGREYVDPMNQYANLAGIGQATTTGLGGLREGFANSVAKNTVDAGRLRAAGELGRSNAYAEGARGVGDYFSERRG